MNVFAIRMMLGKRKHFFTFPLAGKSGSQARKGPSPAATASDPLAAREGKFGLTKHQVAARTFRLRRLRLANGVETKLLCLLSLILALQPVASAADATSNDSNGQPSVVADPAQVGGESASTVQIAQLVYAGDKSSECFSDHFLMKAEQDSSLTTSRRFHTVKLSSDDVYNFPLVIMTGEGDFTLTTAERNNLRQYVERGGFLLASAGCSSTQWDASFRREMAKVFQDVPMQPLSMEHLIFHTVYDIDKLEAKNDDIKPLEGIHQEDRLGVLYSRDGLNDTKHAQGCCCCGGNEITNSEMVNVNILVYSLMH